MHEESVSYFLRSCHMLPNLAEMSILFIEDCILCLGPHPRWDDGMIYTIFSNSLKSSTK
jgi:hypothetical protein